MLATCIGPVPVFDNVMVLAELVAPSTVDENVIDAGVNDATGAVPTPVRIRLCAVPRLKESSAIFSCPLTKPVTDGANDTVTVQFDPPARLPGQLDVSVNPPLAEIVPRFSGLPPKLAIVIHCTATTF